MHVCFPHRTLSAFIIYVARKQGETQGHVAEEIVSRKERERERES